jgi:FAD/FMN-containing dehydrogenase
MTSYLDLVAERATGRVTPALVAEIRALVGDAGLITEPAQLRVYECDGLTGFRVTPALVVLPAATEEVAGVVRVCARERIPFVARGAGTGLSGGALPVADGIVIGLSRMRAVLGRGGAAQPVLRAGSVQPGGVHHRRERRGELRWRALPEVRVHHQPRARAHVRHRAG